MKKVKHGGQRKNAGRKTELSGVPTRNITITLDDLTHRRLKVIGGGNVSRGVRLSAEKGYEAYQRESD